MSDTAEDIAINKIERQLRATRDPSPCDKFGEMSKSILLCDLCGWDENAHIDKDHELALEMDAERTA